MNETLKTISNKTESLNFQEIKEAKKKLGEIIIKLEILGDFLVKAREKYPQLKSSFAMVLRDIVEVYQCLQKNQLISLRVAMVRLETLCRDLLLDLNNINKEGKEQLQLENEQAGYEILQEFGLLFSANHIAQVFDFYSKYINPNPEVLQDGIDTLRKAWTEK